MLMAFPACNDDPNEVPAPQPEPVLTPSEQQDFLEQTALELISKVPSTDFENLVSLGTNIVPQILSYDVNEVQDWGKEAVENFTKYIDQATKEGVTYKNYETLITLSGFKGHFTANPNTNKWEYTPAEDLQFSFKSNDGKSYVANLVTSGQTKKIHIQTTESNSNTPGLIHRDSNNVEIPEQIAIIVTKNGNPVLQTIVETDVKDIPNSEYDLSISQLSFTITTNLNNGYSFVLNQAKIAGNAKEAGIGIQMKKNKESLISMSLSATPLGIPSTIVSKAIDEGFKDFDYTNINGKDGIVAMDILGKIQVIGHVNDIKAFAGDVIALVEGGMDINEAETIVKRINNSGDLALYYNHGSLQQAKIVVAAVPTDPSDIKSGVKILPTIVMADGTSYTDPLEFFNLERFSSVIEAGMQLVEGYFGLIGAEE